VIDPADLAGRRVVVVSPHFDDVPLSLGQSLLDGALSAATVDVVVAFARTNWSVQLHPSRGRAPLVGLWRRLEELVASRRFGYRFRTGGFEEVILRRGTTDAHSFLDGSDPTEDPLHDDVVDAVGRWARGADELWVPAGVGQHVDHRLVAAGGVRVLAAGGRVVFWEDRPYASLLREAEVAEHVAALGLDLHPVAVSGPVQRSTQRAVQRIYRSQMDDLFRASQQLDLDHGRCERAWVPVGSGLSAQRSSSRRLRPEEGE